MQVRAPSRAARLHHCTFVVLIVCRNVHALSCRAEHICGASGLPPWMERWLPIKRLSDEEWEEHERKKKADFKARWVSLASYL